MSSTLIEIAPTLIERETPADAAAVESLVLAAFGPGRFAKTAERLREGTSPVMGLVARDGAAVIASVRLWPIRIGDHSAVFLGPIAVAAGRRSGGLGADLVQACLNHAASAGLGVLLVGDLAYFSRFGFLHAADARLPGPVDQTRVLWRGPAPSPEGLVRTEG